MSKNILRYPSYDIERKRLPYIKLISYFESITLDTDTDVIDDTGCLMPFWLDIRLFFYYNRILLLVLLILLF